MVIQYMFRDTISLESKNNRKSLYDGKKVKYKTKNSIPHDLGDPCKLFFENILLFIVEHKIVKQYVMIVVVK